MNTTSKTLPITYTETHRLARPLLLIPAAVLCDAGFGDLGDLGLVYETAADARAHLADMLSDMDSAHDEQLIERVVAAAVTLDNPTADQRAEAESHITAGGRRMPIRPASRGDYARAGLSYSK